MAFAQEQEKGLEKDINGRARKVCSEQVRKVKMVTKSRQLTHKKEQGFDVMVAASTLQSALGRSST